MKTGDLFIQEEPINSSIDIYRHNNAIKSDGTTGDEKICSVYSADHIDSILKALDVKEEEFEDVVGYPRMIIDDVIDEEEYDSMIDVDINGIGNITVDE